MKNLDSSIIDVLLGCDLFSACSRKDLARMIPFIERQTVKAGDTIYTLGDDASAVYVLLSGEVELRSERRSVNKINQGSFGEECIRKKGKYLLQAEALKDSEVIAVPGEIILDVMTTSPGLRDSLYGNMVNHFSMEKLGKIEKSKSRKGEDKGLFQIVGWLVSIILPIIAFANKDTFGFTWEQGLFTAVGLAAVLMWSFRLVGEFIPSIMAILVILVLQVVPNNVVLSGFTSGSFFMAMSIFGISALLVVSGLTYRMVINILRIVPMSQRWHAIAIFVTGIFLTPVLPSANGRIALASPLLIDMIESLGYKKHGKAATFLGAVTFSGFTFFSTVFLSSKAIHFVIFGLFPEQVQHQFTWSYWFYASLPAFLIMLVLFIVAVGIFFMNDEKPQLSRELIEHQRIILGPLTRLEWAALGGLLLFALGVATSSLHKIHLPWVGLTVLYVILVLGFLNKTDFRSKIDWSFLIFLGTLIGFVKAMSFTGLDVIIGHRLAWLGDYMRSDMEMFILLLTVIILVLRYFIPNNATVVLMASVLFPIAELNGINSWVIAFIILMISDAWFFPHQSTFYILFDELMAEKNYLNTRNLLMFNAVTFIFRIAAVYVSLPFWRYIGIL